MIRSHKMKKHLKLWILAFTLLWIPFTMNAQKVSSKGKAKTTYTKNKSNRTSPKNDGLTPLERKVVGKHKLSLQWISWDYFGTANIVKEADGRLRCTGQQLSRENDDYLKIDGYINIQSDTHLVFVGTITTKIYHIYNGEPYVREGTYDFIATKGRKFWRLQQMDNGDCTDYVDIFFKGV